MQRIRTKLNRPIRVLVVDDSVVIRRLLTTLLEEDAAIEVVGSAPNGELALQKIRQLKPDAITLDVEMPVMDGLTALRHIRKEHPDLCVIMLSTHTDRGASITTEALMLGADDYLTKPAVTPSQEPANALRTALIGKLKQFFTTEQQDSPRPASAATAVRKPSLTGLRVKPRVLAIGLSTGGPAALAVALPMLPADFPLPVLIVQHMPPSFTRYLAQQLQPRVKLQVDEAVAGVAVERGKILIAPGDYHLKVAKTNGKIMTTLDQCPPENSCRPAVDPLFRSVAEVYGPAAVGVVLTGMGRDGLLGAKAMKSAGAYIVAQDEASSVVWGMPGQVVRAGLADAVVDLQAVVSEVLAQL